MKTTFIKSSALAVLFLLLTPSISAQEWKEVLQVLPPVDNASPFGGQNDDMGRSVAVFGDYAIAGAPFSDVNGTSSGAAFLYKKLSGAWILLSQLTPSDAALEDRFGWSVAIQDSSIIIGAPGSSPLATSSGAVYVFDKIGGVWTETAKVYPAVGESYNEFGTDVDIDGNILIASSPLENGVASNTGATYVFEKVGGVWTEQTKLTASDAGQNDNFGLEIALDDTTVFCGSFGNDALGNNRGAVYMYRRDGGMWAQVDRLNAPDMANGDNFGISVGADQGRLVVGSRRDDDNGNQSGSAYVFSESGGVYSFEQKLIASDGANNDEFGSSVGISGDNVVIGSQKNDDGGQSSGSIYVYEYGTSWVESTKLIAYDDEADDRYGFSVGVSSTTVLTGARLDDDAGINSGSVYIYDNDSGGWAFGLKSSDNDMIDTPTDDNFGFSVSLSWDNAVVSSYRDGDYGASSGSARFYGFDGSQWQDFGKVYASTPGLSDNFGFKTAISGDVAIIGAYGDDDKGNNAGAAYIFQKNGPVWSEVKKLTAGDGEAYDNFGWSVGVDGDVMAVGAYLDDDNANAAGAVYIYEYNGSDWALVSKVISSDGGGNQYFGSSLDVDGDMIIVGARSDASQVIGGGAAYIIQKIAGTWSEVAKLQPSVPSTNKFFGWSVSISDGVAMVGATGDAGGGTNSGAVYVFEDVGGWAQQAKLKANVITEGQYFGISVDNIGSYALIGAYGARNASNLKSGAGYIFEDPGTGWTQVDTLFHNSGLANDQFGISVALKGKSLLIGAQFDDDNGEESGAAYFFSDCLDADANGVCDYEEIFSLNNVCDSAVAMPSSLWGVPEWDTLSFLGANESLPGCAGDADDDIWFSFIAEHSNDMVLAQDPDEGYDVVIEIFDGCGGMSLGCFDNYGPGEIERAMPGGLVPGSSYIYRVYDQATGSSVSTDVRTIVKTFASGGIRGQYCGRMDYSLEDVITPQRQDLNQLYPFTATNVRGYGILFVDEATGDSIEYEQFGQVSQYFRFQDINGLEYNHSYEIRAKHLLKLQANGTQDFFWSEYGPSCIIGLAGPVETTIKPQYCDNASGYSLNDIIQAYPVPFATQYKFVLDDGVQQLVKYTAAYTLFFYQVNGMSLNKTYDVTVQSRVNGLWSPPGPGCTINMLTSTPQVALQSQFCGGSYPYPSAAYLLSENAQGADMFQWRFTPSGGGDPQYQITNGLSLAFHWANDLDLVPGSSYDVAIRVRMGGVWGDYGAECTIDLFASGAPVDDVVVVKSLHSSAGKAVLKSWPNPIEDEFMISLEGLESIDSRAILIRLFSIGGELVMEESVSVKGDEMRLKMSFSDELAAGLYRLEVIDGLQSLGIQIQKAF